MNYQEYCNYEFHKKRLKAVKKSHFWLTNRKCCKCGTNCTGEKSWKVNRWAYDLRKNEVSYKKDTYYYCLHCCPTKEDVLFEIDHDDNEMGIYKVGPFELVKPFLHTDDPKWVPPIPTMYG